MEKIVIPSIHDDFVKAFRDLDYDTMRKLRESVESIYKDLFDRLMSGEIDGFYYDQNPGNATYNTYLYTRSVKTDGIQRTAIYHINDEEIPLSDSQYHDFEDMRKDGCRGGVSVYFYTLEDFLKKSKTTQEDC